MKSVKRFTTIEAENFQDVLSRSGLSAREFAASLGITEAHVSNILREVRKPSREILERLATVYGVDLNSYLFGDGGVHKSIDTEYVELFRLEAAAGTGIEVDEYAERFTVPIAKKYLKGRNKDYVKAVFVKGDSMIDENICDGDTVYFDMQEKEGENIFVLSLANTLLVKRVVRDYVKHTITLLSANKIYAPRIIEGTDTEQVRIEGRVIAWTHGT